MEIAATALPATPSVSLARNHACSTDHNKNSGPKPLLQVSLPLRRPHKPSPSLSHDKHRNVAGNANSHKTIVIRKNNKHMNMNRNRKSPACTVSDVLNLMDALSIPTTPDTYASLIKECIVTADICGADALHKHITGSGQHSVSLLNRLLLLHVSHDRVDVARDLFDRIPSKDFKSWAVVIVAYVNRGNHGEALSLFMKLLSDVEMIEFPAWMMVCLLKTCVFTENMDLGKQVHGFCFKTGHVNSLFLGSCLIDFYGKFKCLEGANLVFDRLPCHSTKTWMARLSNNLREKLFVEVLKDYKEIGKAGTKRNTSVVSTALKACARMCDAGKSGRQVHADAIKLGFESDPYVHCGLVDMYGRSGLLGDAEKVFEIRGEGRNNACWNAMLGAYIRNEFYVEAIRFIYEMKDAGVQLRQSLRNELRIACGSSPLKELYSGSLVG